MVPVQLYIRVLPDATFKNLIFLPSVSDDNAPNKPLLICLEINFYRPSSRRHVGFLCNDMSGLSRFWRLGIYEILILQRAYLKKTLGIKGTTRNGFRTSMRLRQNNFHNQLSPKGYGRYCDLKRITRSLITQSALMCSALGGVEVLGAEVIERGPIESLPGFTQELLAGHLTASVPVRAKKRRPHRDDIPTKLTAEPIPIENLLSAQPSRIGEIEQLTIPTHLARHLPRAVKTQTLNGGITVRVDIHEGQGEPVARVVDKPGSAQDIQINAFPETDSNHQATQKSVSDSGGKSIYEITKDKDTGELSISSSTLIFPEVGNYIDVKIAKDPDFSVQNDLRVFVRHSKIAQFEKHNNILKFKALAVGKTEAYFVVNEHMMIVPIEVSSSALMVKRDDKAPLFRPLVFAPEVVQLADLTPKEALGGMVSLDKVKSSRSMTEKEAQLNLDAIVNEIAEDRSDLNVRDDSSGNASRSQNIVSLNQSVQETEKSLAYMAAQKAKLSTKQEEFSTIDVTIQVVDDRTPLIIHGDSSKSAIYPVTGVRVEIPGTDFQGFTDSMGYLVIRGVPRTSTILMRMSDVSGAMVNTVAEIQAQDGVQRVVMHRTFAYELAQNLTGLTATADTGSVCAEIDSPPSLGEKFKVTTVGIDKEVYYVDNLGIIDTGLKHTESIKRFCLFNVDPGPLTIKIETGDATESIIDWTVSFGIYSGVHQNISVPLIMDQKVFQTKLVSVGSAHENLAPSSPLGSEISIVDFTEAFVLGQSIPMAQPTVGQLEAENGLDFFGGSASFFVEAPEFENAIYSVKQEELNDHVTALMPKGFIEDMALYAQVIPDPQKGTVYAEFAHYQGVTSAVNIKLVDQFGKVAGNSWYFGDTPLTKALFFNVEPGRYSVVVETREGDWIDSQIINVYSETSSVVRMGEQLVIGN
jgi:hypothetical protein